MTSGKDEPAPAGIGAAAVRGSLWSVLTFGLLLPLNFATSVVVARLLGPQDFGDLALLVTFIAIAGPFTDFGFGQALLQWSGRALGAGRPSDANTMFRKSLGFDLLVQVPLMALGGMYLLRREPLTYVILYVFLLLVGATIGNAATRLAAENRTSARAGLNFASAVAGNAAACALAAAHASPATIYLVRAFAGLLPALPVVLLLAPAARRSLVAPALPLSMPNGFWSFARYAWVAAALGAVVANRSEVFVLEAYGQAAAVGLFAVVFGLAVQATSVLDVLQANFGPALTYLAGRDETALRRVVTRALDLFGLGAACVLAAGGGLVLAVPLLYGDAYADGLSLLPPLLIASCIQTSLAPFAALAIVRRRRRALVIVQATTVFLDLGLAALLIPPLGILGAVIAAAVALVAVNVGLALAEVRSLAPVLSALWRTPLALGAVAGALGLTAGALVPTQEVVGVVLAEVVALTCFASLVVTFRRTVLREVLTDVQGMAPRWLRSSISAVTGRL